MVPELGEILGGKYRILRVLGEGGMGAVYEAENVLTLKRAAIKRLHAQMLAHDEGYQRVLHEARASARIRHRNVVDVYDVVSEGNAICLVMELLLGESLSALIARGGLHVHDYVALLLPAMEGVAAAHAVGVIHRDIKPENIFLVNEPGLAQPVPKVIDFGISKVTDPGDLPQLTRSGITMGTPRYVSYEQLVGAKNVDERADVYAFGVMLYEALTGRAPYNATTFGQQAICFATMVPNPPRVSRSEVPEALDALVWRAIARDREERFPSLRALINALTPFARAEAFAQPLLAFPAVTGEATGAPLFALTTTPANTTPIPVGGWHETPQPARVTPVVAAPLPPKPRAKLWWWGIALLAAALLVLAFQARRGAAPTDTALAKPREATLGPSPLVVPAPGDAPKGTKPYAGSAESDGVAAPPSTEAPGRQAVTPVQEPARPATHGASAKRSTKASQPAAPTPQGEPAAAPAMPPPPAQPAPPAQDNVHRAGRVRRDQF